VDLTFANALRSILRQDPDVILVGEIRDLETADVAIKAALTGHLVLSTLHTNTAAGAVVRLTNMGIEPFLISSSMILVTAQRLVRKICEQCKEIYEVPPAVLARLGSAFETKIGKVNFYRGRGCEECRKNGYKGRVGIIETLMMSPKIKKLIVKHAQEYEIKQAARGEGMRTLREDGLEKVRQGLTTIEEVLRVSVGDQD
jgi:type II secretory ATPase GspE/PulE/Tfp pilus assembly ATPase PilB-like protein